MKKIKNINSTRFIIMSVVALFVFLFLSLVLLPLIFFQAKPKIDDRTFYFNQNFDEQDPLMTAVPNLDKIISGPIITQADPQIGPVNAKVNIVLFTDFKSDYSYNSVKNIQTIQQSMPDKIKFIHKDFPINNINSESFQASLAGRCAQVQNKFWEYSDLLYQNNDDLERDNLIKLAKDLKLNLKEFKQCLDDYEEINAINDNLQEAYALKITGIPFVFINDQEILGSTGYQEIANLVKQELKK